MRRPAGSGLRAACGLVSSLFTLLAVPRACKRLSCLERRKSREQAAAGQA